MTKKYPCTNCGSYFTGCLSTSKGEKFNYVWYCRVCSAGGSISDEEYKKRERYYSRGRNTK